MPLIRRIPKRGFNNARFRTRYLPVNVEALNRFEDGAAVDEAALRTVGLANGRADGVKILGEGNLTKKLTVNAHAFSTTARSKIEARGGTCQVVAPACQPRAKSAKVAKADSSPSLTSPPSRDAHPA